MIMDFLLSMPGATLTLAILIALGVILSNMNGKPNMGLVCMAFAWIWGVFVLGYSCNEILGQFPTSTFLRLMVIMMMYGYGMMNGTIKLLSRKILYPFRNHAWMVPLMCIVVGGILGVTIGNTAMAAFVPILFMSIGIAGGWKPALFAFISSMCGPVFGLLPFSQCGSIIQGILENTAYAADAPRYTLYMWLNAVPCFVIFLIICYFVTGAYKVKKVEMDKPESFNSEQKRTLILFGTVCVVLMVTAMCSILLPDTFIGKHGDKFNLIFVALTGAVLCPLLKLGTQADALASGRWNVYLMVAGIGTLVNVASKYGCVTWLGTIISEVFPSFLIVPVLGVVCFAMCCFMSFQAVLPVVFPLIPVIAGVTGIDPTRMMSTLFMFTIIASYCPYSVAGMLNNAQCPREDLREEMFKHQFIIVGGGCLYFLVAYFVGLTGIFQV